MVSKFQWKPFWLATQRNLQSDWTATQNGVNYDVFAQAPFWTPWWNAHRPQCPRLFQETFDFDTDRCKRRYIEKSCLLVLRRVRNKNIVLQGRRGLPPSFCWTHREEARHLLQTDTPWPKRPAFQEKDFSLPAPEEEQTVKHVEVNEFSVISSNLQTGKLSLATPFLLPCLCLTTLVLTSKIAHSFN